MCYEINITIPVINSRKTPGLTGFKNPRPGRLQFKPNLHQNFIIHL